jgi:hypothetical protein
MTAGGVGRGIFGDDPVSWARIDDGLWEHEKFEALRYMHEHTAGFLWLLAISHCGAKLNPRITVPEARMLLDCSEAEAKSACEVLRSTGLFCLDSASEHVSSYLIHDWKQYRSKDEAKVRAGRKGGKKSAALRAKASEANSKQDRSKGQAELKQSPSPDTDTDTDTIPVTDTDTGGGNNKPWRSGNPISSLLELETAMSLWSFGTSLSSSEIIKAKKIINAGAIPPHEIDQALSATRKKKRKRPIAYFLGVIDGVREDARSSGAEGPGAPPTTGQYGDQSGDDWCGGTYCPPEDDPDDLSR